MRKHKMIPANMRYTLRIALNCLGRHRFYLAWKYPQAIVVTKFLTPIEKHLHSNADAEQWSLGFRESANGFIEPAFRELSNYICKSPNTWHYETIRRNNVFRILNNANSSAAIFKCPGDIQ